LEVLDVEDLLAELADKNAVSKECVMGLLRQSIARAYGGRAAAILYDNGGVDIPSLAPNGRLEFIYRNLSNAKLRQARDYLDRALKEAAWDIYGRKILRWLAGKNDVVVGVIVGFDETSGLCELEIEYKRGEKYDGLTGLLFSRSDGILSDRNRGIYSAGQRLTLSYRRDSNHGYRRVKNKHSILLSRRNKQWLWEVLSRAEQNVFDEKSFPAAYLLGDVDFDKGVAIVYCYEKALTSKALKGIVEEVFIAEGFRIITRLSAEDTPLLQERRERNKHKWGFIDLDVLNERLNVIASKDKR
jgi:hypothetical protein